jgi:cytochrome c551/c552
MQLLPTRASCEFAMLFACAFVLAACGGPANSSLSCVVVKTECSPLYDPPTYAAIYSKIFQPTCAAGRGTCHTADAKMGGLFFQNPAEAYQLLIGVTDGRARVLRDNPGCSLLAERLESRDRRFQMPPGTPLSDAELCTVMKWLAAGAPESP